LDLGSGLVAVRIVGRRDGREKEAEEWKKTLKAFRDKAVPRKSVKVDKKKRKAKKGKSEL